MGKPAIGGEAINELFQGSMGIKTISVGPEPIYTRPGGYFYLELNTKGDVNNG